MMKIRFKVLSIIIEILLFLSFFLTWFGDGNMITLRGVDLQIFIGWLLVFYIGTWFSVFSLSKKFHIISLIASICVFLLEIYKFFTWHYLTITGYISLTFSRDMTSFGFYLSLFICFVNIILKIICMKLCIKPVYKNEKEVITK